MLGASSMTALVADHCGFKDASMSESFRPSKKFEPRLSYSGNVIESSLHSIIPLLQVSAGFKQKLNYSSESLDVDILPQNAEKFLKLNVGGTSYRLRSETILKRTNGSLLYTFILISHERRLEIADDFLDETGEYFFERSARLFDPVYQYYITGVCHRPRDLCVDVFVTELVFWGVIETYFGECCWPQPYNKASNGDIMKVIKGDEFDEVCAGTFRRQVWNLLEVPESSMVARVVSFLSMMAVLVSNIGLIIGSIPEFQVDTNRTWYNPQTNRTHTVHFSQPHPILEWVEACCVAWFTVEYVGKLAAAADRKRVFWEILNIIDLIAIVPFYIELTLQLSGFDTSQLEELKGALLVIRILRVLRVIRIFKLGRYSSGLRAFARTLQASVQQLSMLAVVLVTGIMFFSTLVYFLEKDEPQTGFSSIPAAFWWCIVTMTTVGYGDVVPITVAGKLVASGAIATGILVLALPITIIIDNFMKVQEEQGETALANHPLVRRSTIHHAAAEAASATSQLL